MSHTPRAMLIVLDGFGNGPDSPYNAIANARKPFFRTLLERYPVSQLLTHGQAVGLPQGVMGNSEVGHQTMGSGRVLYQDLTRISRDIETKAFYDLPKLKAHFKTTLSQNGRIHLMGLLSDGGVHSTLEHLFALLTLTEELKAPEVYVHAFLDGRDTPPDSGLKYIEALENHSAFKRGIAHIATMSGRYYAMDRDTRWERVEKTYKVMTGESAVVSNLTPLQALERSYALKVSDEFFEPMLFNQKGIVRSQDGLMFFNYRSDRARELTAAFVNYEFSHFKRPNLKLSSFLGMTQYDSKSNAPFLYGPQNQTNLMGAWLEKHNRSQMRIAETEKYAHVTFFFNGGRELPFIGENRILIPSPKDIATYDLKPEMSAYEVSTAASHALESNTPDFTVMNFANADMVGHTGNYEAAVRAIETLDRCLSQVVGVAHARGVHTLITADHGNAEQMCDDHDKIHTQHTLNPVPLVYVEPGSSLAPKTSLKKLRDGTLADLMPTLLNLMQLPIPEEVEGKSLL